MRAWTLVALAALCACTKRDNPSEGAPTLVPTAAAAPPLLASSSNATLGTPAPRFVGRFVPEPGGNGMRFAWPGTAIIARFKGTSISMRLRDEGWNLFQVVVDGETKRVLQTNNKKESWLLVDGLTDTQHDILVEKRTEAKVGEAVFYGFDVGGGGKLLPPANAPDRRIEIIGDSISTGYGNEGPGAECGFVNSQENEYLAYGALAARALDADHTTIAWSGKTLYEMREYFDKSLPARNDASPRWDFTQYQPQVVVVNVGTNNFANIDPGEKRFVELYHALIGKVRAAYPKAFIVCALGSMLSDIYPEGRRNLTQARKYMKVAVAKLKENGDTNLDLLEFPEQNHADGLGCGFHPSLKTHEHMSKRLVAFLKERMGW